MPSSKVYLTYKRKLPSLSSSSLSLSSRSTLGCSHGSIACHGSLHEVPTTTSLVATVPEKSGDALGHEQVSENQERNPLIFEGCFSCGVRGNLLRCGDCDQPYHQCLDALRKLDSSTVHSNLTSRMEAEEKGLDTKMDSSGRSPSPVGGNGGQIASGEDTGLSPSHDLLSESKLCHSKGSPFLVMKEESAGKLASELLGVNTGKSLDHMGSKSLVRNCGSACDTSSCLLSGTHVEGTDSLSVDKSIDILGDMHVQAKGSTTLITFARRHKRREDNDNANVKASANFKEKQPSWLAKWSKGCSGDDPVDVKQSLADVKLQAEDPDLRGMCCQNKEKLEDVGSKFLPVGSNIESKISLKSEELQPLYSRSISRDASPITEQELGQSSKTTPDAINGPSEALITDRDSADFKYQEKPDVAPIGGGTVKAMHDSMMEERFPHFNLSINPPESHFMPDLNVNLDLGSQTQSVLAVSEALGDSIHSMGTIHATILQEVSPKLSGGLNEIVEESPPVPSTKALNGLSAGEICAEFKNDGEATCGSPTNDASKKKCLQLLSEEKANKNFHSAATEPEGTTCMVLEHPGCNTNQMRETSNSSLLDLGLSLRTGPRWSDYLSKESSTTLPLWNHSSEIGEFIQDAAPQSSFNQASSLMRHKFMPDSILNQASASNAKDGLQEESCCTPWSEEELDSLWIGVRRHGRDNWLSVLRDPRLRFSSCRGKRDLAERWDVEQANLLNDTHILQFKPPIKQYISLDHNSWRENATHETEHSLRDVYDRCAGSALKRRRLNFIGSESNVAGQPYRLASHPQETFYADCQVEPYARGPGTYSGRSLRSNPLKNSVLKSSLPCWLREALSTPVRLTEAMLPPGASSVAKAGTIGHARPFPVSCEPRFGLSNRMHGQLGGLKASELHQSGPACYSTVAFSTIHGIMETKRGSLYQVGKPDDLIVIDSDASSEETISDDHSARP